MHYLLLETILTYFAPPLALSKHFKAGLIVLTECGRQHGES